MYSRLAISLILSLPAWAQPSPAPPLAFADALTRVERDNPRLRAFSWELSAADARVLQAALRPNPTLSLEIEDLPLGEGAGSTTVERELGLSTPPVGLTGSVQRVSGGEDSGLDRAEITLSIAWPLELGKKRLHRVAAATAEQTAVAREYDSLRADVLSAAARAYVEALRAEARGRLSQERLQVLDESAETIRIRVEAGKTSPVELKKILIERDTAALDAARGEADHRAARIDLASFWGAEKDEFGALAGDLAEMPPPPAPDVIEGALRGNPEMALWAARGAVQRAQRDLAKAEAVPDLEVRLGIRSAGAGGFSGDGWRLERGGVSWVDERETTDRDREHSLVLELGVPIPLFNRNQGTLREAEALGKRSDAEAVASLSEIRAGLARLYLELEATRTDVRVLDEKLLPLAEASLDSTRLGYREGKFGVLDLLDAERTRAELKERRLDMLSSWHQARLEIERLLGTHTQDESPLPATEQRPVPHAPRETSR